MSACIYKACMYNKKYLVNYASDYFIWYTEIFEIVPAGGQNVTILGQPTPRGNRMQLSVREDGLGVPDRFPQFRQLLQDQVI